MTLNNRTFLVIVTVLTIIFTVVIVLLGGAWWIGPTLCLPMAGLVYVAMRAQAQSPQPVPPQAMYVPPAPPPPPAPNNVQIRDVVLPSADRDYKFRLHGLVFWRPAGGSVDPHRRTDSLAVNAITERAAELTGTEPAGDYELVRSRLSAALALPVVDRTGLVETWAQDISLVVPDNDAQRLQKLAELRKNMEVWEHQRDYERDLRAYFHDDVLKSTGSALVWWLVQDVTKVSDAVAMIGKLAQLSAVARDTKVDPLFLPFVTPSFSEHEPEPMQPEGFLSRGGDGSDFPTAMNGHDSHLPQDIDVVSAVRKLLDVALPGSSEPERAHLADRLASAVSEVDAHDLAMRIREAFDAPDFNDIIETQNGHDQAEPQALNPFTQDT